MRLEAAGVGKDIDGNVLLAPVDLAVTSGECVVLRGENGSGKTTLLRILAGTLEASEGSATLDGGPLDERDPATRARVAALIGYPTAYRDLTLIDHLVLIDSTWGGDDRHGRRAGRRPARRASRSTTSPSASRTSCRRASSTSSTSPLVLFRPSRVLLLDEPEQRLDTHKRGLLTELLLARKAAGGALVVACHDPAMTDAIADRVIDVVGP